MPNLLYHLDLSRHSRRLRVDTLVKLRWLALVGQTATLVFVHSMFGFPLPLELCFLVLACSAVLNICLRLRFRQNERFGDVPAAAMLAFDILQLSALLYLTGGIDNPFSMLFLVPIMISAVSLSGRMTLMLTLLVIVVAGFLTLDHYPLPWFRDQTMELSVLYSAGIWFAIVLGAAFIAIYASRVAEEARKLADALTATELVIAREQHLTQLDGLAAAAAHELGTPLATITLVVKDLEKQFSKGPLKEDIALLSQEVARCRSILSKLTSLEDDSGSILGDMSLDVLLEEVAGPQRDFGVEISIAKSGSGREPLTDRNPSLLYGLGNLVENAVDFADTKVSIHASWDRFAVQVKIEDDGPGFSPDVIAHIGEPYLTTREDRRFKSEEGSGLGLGLFIAKTLLERSGASVETENQAPPKRGAVVKIKWPRSVFEKNVSKPKLEDAKKIRFY